MAILSVFGFDDLINNFLVEYKKNTLPRIRLIDSFILFSLFLTFLQITYISLIGTYPYNPFISSLSCSLGFFVLTVCLRIQLLHPVEFGNLKPESSIAGYIVCCLFLFFIAITAIDNN